VIDPNVPINLDPLAAAQLEDALPVEVELAEAPRAQVPLVDHT
jgi:hypothetical protein